MNTGPEAKDPKLVHAWNQVLSQLQGEMTRADFRTWVEPLIPLRYTDGVFRVLAANSYAQDWVQQRLGNKIATLLSAYYAPDPVQLKISTPTKGTVYHTEPAETAKLIEEPAELNEVLPRKVFLQRAYGSERAKIIQPERGAFVTNYFFSRWLPLIGHSAFVVILAARSLCYWNPKTNELRNTVDTEMGELAKRASVSVRTVKQVLADELVKQYFLKYTIRRMMTPNGVRTAGITLTVRMDDPLTPEDSSEHQLAESKEWF